MTYKTYAHSVLGKKDYKGFKNIKYKNFVCLQSYKSIASLIIKLGFVSNTKTSIDRGIKNVFL